MVLATNATAGYAFRVDSIEATTLIQGNGELRFGDDVYLNSGSRVECAKSVRIESHVIVGYGAIISDTDWHGIGALPVREAPVVIGQGSWIGARAIILPGVSLGRRVIVGAGAIVTRDVPDDTIVAGNPARIVRTLDLPDGQVKAYN